MANPTGGDFRQPFGAAMNAAYASVVMALGAVESQENSYSGQHFIDITAALNDARDSLYAALLANGNDQT